MRLLLLPLAAAVALSAAGCGGGTLNGTSNPSTSASRPAATSTSAATTPGTASTTASTPSTTPAPARTTSTTAPRPTPTPPTRAPAAPNAAFVAQANGICAHADRALGAKLKQNPRIAATRDVRAAAQLLIPYERARIAGLEALAPPASIGVRYAQLTAAMRSRLASLQHAAATGSGKSLPSGSQLALQRSTQRVMTLGASLGLNCAG